ncbi:hypothetical protein Pla22_35200 [Rubripirellula amarantea]|uniref:Uncharacterized protein n=1 Tax=Rubripirellula amarantea TaxID=2527999 RepID=A0A5C5WJN2_9BACT|nr:hypothetical protein Pla22_35200 [Rubripirellula amarantea]
MGQTMVRAMLVGLVTASLVAAISQQLIFQQLIFQQLIPRRALLQSDTRRGQAFHRPRALRQHCVATR